MHNVGSSFPLMPLDSKVGMTATWIPSACAPGFLLGLYAPPQRTRRDIFCVSDSQTLVQDSWRVPVVQCLCARPLGGPGGPGAYSDRLACTIASLPCSGARSAVASVAMLFESTRTLIRSLRRLRFSDPSGQPKPASALY